MKKIYSINEIGEMVNALRKVTIRDNALFSLRCIHCSEVHRVDTREYNRFGKLSDGDILYVSCPKCKKGERIYLKIIKVDKSDNGKVDFELMDKLSDTLKDF